MSITSRPGNDSVIAKGYVFGQNSIKGWGMMQQGSVHKQPETIIPGFAESNMGSFTPQLLKNDSVAPAADTIKCELPSANE